MLELKAPSGEPAVPRYEVAHINRQGVDIIMIPFGRNLASRTPDYRADLKAELQRRATEAGLKGGVVLYWIDHSGRTMMLGPPAWMPFLRGFSVNDVWRRINRSIFWT